MIDLYNLLLILLTIAAIYFTFKHVKLQSTKSSLRLPPHFSYFSRLLKGDFNLKQNGPIELIKEGYKSLGDIFRIRLLHRHVTFLIGGEASSLVFASSDSDISAKNVYGFMIPVFGKGIVYDASNEIMAQQVKWIFFGLGKKYFETYCEKIFIEAYDFFQQYPDDGVRNVHNDMLELVSFTASRCLLGDEVREKLTTETGHLLKAISDGVSHISLFFPRLPTKKHRMRDAARAKIIGAVMEIIEKRRNNNEKPHDYLQHLMDSSYRNNTKPSDENIAGLILATLFGGQHTSSNILTWIVMLAAKHKERFLERYLEEQRSCFGEKKFFDIEKLDKMIFLHNTIKETLRMFPPLIILARKVLKPLCFKNFYVPKGDIVAVCPSVTHRLPHVYKDPDVFDPDRFSSERNEGSGQYEHQPFGGGKHICVGRNFAYIQIKIIFSVFLQMFDFELIDKNWEPKVDYSHIIAGPVENNFVRVRRKPQEQVFFKCRTVDDNITL